MRRALSICCDGGNWKARAMVTDLINPDYFLESFPRESFPTIDGYEDASRLPKPM